MSQVLTMAKQQPPEKGKPKFTTFRLYAEDGEDLSELADKLNKSIADVYREKFSRLIREELAEVTRKRLRELEGRK
ncbi:MAG TPA: hypothetical protein VM529_13465 [Gemmata sp.]|jgi:hypothetical protein|nr:hypothetical protein [Gemmata sp.]